MKGKKHSCCSEPAIAPRGVIAAAPSGEVIGATSIASEKFAGVYEDASTVSLSCIKATTGLPSIQCTDSLWSHALTGYAGLPNKPGDSSPYIRFALNGHCFAPFSGCFAVIQGPTSSSQVFLFVLQCAQREQHQSVLTPLSVAQLMSS